MTTQPLHSLEFRCIECDETVLFSLLNLESEDKFISCPGCQKNYSLQDPTLKRQLQKFEALCLQVRDSEEILSSTCVAVTLGNKEVEVPYKLLLTRLSTKLHLKIGSENLSITFRIDPSNELSLTSLSAKE